MARKIIIAGNWKMHKTNNEAIQLSREIKMAVSDISKTQVVICPPSTALTVVSDVIGESAIGLGAQNMHWEKEGAFTGELSAGMIKSTGANYVIIGHSERRQYFGETDENVNKKVKTAIGSGLRPIVCVGESLEEREDNITTRVIEKQIRGGLKDLGQDEIRQVIIAYEPVWAIGTGKTATPDQAQEVHLYIRKLIDELFGSDIAGGMRIQYGGSVKPDNADALLSQPDIDGALVGGACLKADSFSEIIHTAENLQK